MTYTFPTCPIPEVRDYQWVRQDSGIIVEIGDSDTLVAVRRVVAPYALPEVVPKLKVRVGWDGSPHYTDSCLPGKVFVGKPVFEAAAVETKPSNPKDTFGSAKVSFSIIPATVLTEVSVGMLDGATKYGRHNYRGCGVRSSIYYDATMRHLTAYWEGQDIDPDSNLHHITKAITSLVVWRDAMIQDMCEDDRPPRTKKLEEFLADMNARAKALTEDRKHLNPKHYYIKDTQ